MIFKLLFPSLRPDWALYLENSCQNVGYVLIYLFSLHLPWRPLAALLLAFPAIALACLLPLPETPYWLARWNLCASEGRTFFLYFWAQARSVGGSKAVVGLAERGGALLGGGGGDLGGFWRTSPWPLKFIWPNDYFKRKNSVRLGSKSTTHWSPPSQVCTGQADSGVGMLKGLRWTLSIFLKLKLANVNIALLVSSSSSSMASFR